MNLIDRDRLIEELYALYPYEYKPAKDILDTVAHMIENQTVAFNKDKVMEQLADEMDMQDCLTNKSQDRYANACIAFHIVDKGGVE